MELAKEIAMPTIALAAVIATLWTTRRQIQASLASNQAQIEAMLEVSKTQNESTLKVAKQQISADVVSRNRQAWINSLRDRISEFVALNSSFVIRGLATPHANAELLQSQVERLFHCKNTILLLLNPNEEDHAELADLLNTVLPLFADVVSNQNLLRSREVEIIEKTQPILKREWERVKQGD